MAPLSPWWSQCWAMRSQSRLICVRKRKTLKKKKKKRNKDANVRRALILCNNAPKQCTKHVLIDNSPGTHAQVSLGVIPFLFTSLSITWSSTHVLGGIVIETTALLNVDVITHNKTCCTWLDHRVHHLSFFLFYYGHVLYLASMMCFYLSSFEASPSTSILKYIRSCSCEYNNVT